MDDRQKAIDEFRKQLAGDNEDDETEADLSRPDVHDESDFEGSAAVPKGYNVLDEVHEIGLYESTDEEHPKEVGIAEEVAKDEEALKHS